jgi:RNA polymerase sigma factor (TIGR02999 family)
MMNDGHDPQPGAEQFLRLYGELRQIAERMLRREAPGHTLQPTALLNEAWLKLGGHDGPDALSREHFLAIAARAMRQVLVEYARRRHAEKRGGDLSPVTFADELVGVSMPIEDLLGLDEALTRLGAHDARLARVVELRFFAGLSEEEIAATLGVTTRTVQRDWVKARAWLQTELADTATPTIHDAARGLR